MFCTLNRHSQTAAGQATDQRQPEAQPKPRRGWSKGPSAAGGLLAQPDAVFPDDVSYVAANGGERKGKLPPVRRRKTGGAPEAPPAPAQEKSVKSGSAIGGPDGVRQAGTAGTEELLSW